MGHMLGLVLIILMVGGVMLLRAQATRPRVPKKPSQAMGTVKLQSAEDSEAITSSEVARAETFVEATGGGWDDVPNRVAPDGGDFASYVAQQLRAAQMYAQANVAVGEWFDFTITNIPAVISPHEIVSGMIMQADTYGLGCGSAMNERFSFKRLA